MSTRRYDITTDISLTHATVKVWDEPGPPTPSRAIARQTVRTNAKQATLNGITRLVLNDYLNAITPPNGGSLPRISKAQIQAVARLIAHRLTGQLQATISSTEISTKLLTPFIAPAPDQWSQRYSVERLSGDGTWTVAKAANGTWGCSCPRWRFKREHCKHIEAVLQHPHWYPYVGKEA